MKRYIIEGKHWAWVCVDGTVALLEENGSQVAEVEVTHDDGTVTPESARRLRVLAVAPEMEELLRLFAKEEENFTCDCTGCKMRRRILRYIETGEET